MPYQTYIPCQALQPYVQSLAIQEMEEEVSYKVLPGTSLVMGFQYRGRLSLVNPDNNITLATAGLSGLQDTYKIFRNTPGIGTVLVYFKEGGAVPFFQQPLHELFRESVSLEQFMLRSELLLLEEQLQEAKSGRQRIAVVERFLLARLSQTPPDPLVLAALALIHQYKGNIRIQELMRQLHISQSPLEKRFRRVVGTSPKKFAAIVRMQQAIAGFTRGASLTALGYEAGFYDQAHFIKEFKTFTGQTPESFFNVP